VPIELHDQTLGGLDFTRAAGDQPGRNDLQLDRAVVAVDALEDQLRCPMAHAAQVLGDDRDAGFEQIGKLEVFGGSPVGSYTDAPGPAA
jgi:hypothetical protein